MTKTSVFNSKPAPKKGKKIEFLYLIGVHTLSVTMPSSAPDEWENIILLANGESYDVMYAFGDERPNSGRVYLGYWNDGIV